LLLNPLYLGESMNRFTAWRLLQNNTVTGEFVRDSASTAIADPLPAAQTTRNGPAAMSAVQAPTTAADYQALLQEMLTTLDNNRRRDVENAIVKSLKTPETAYLLVQLIAEGATVDAAIRQLAAVLLRKKILTLWRGLDLPRQAELKAILLAQMAAEANKQVRMAVAHVLCVLAKVELRNGWPELLAGIRAASAGANEEHRELACVLIHTLADALITADSAEHLDLIGEVVVAGMNDASQAVRQTALKAIGSVVPLLGGSTGAKVNALVTSVVTPTLQIVSSAANGTAPTDPASTRYVLEALDVLEKVGEMDIGKAPYLDAVLQVLLATAGARGAHLRVREESVEILTMIVTARPKMIVKKGLLQPFVDVCLALMCEDEAIQFEATEPGMEADDVAEQEEEGGKGEGEDSGDDGVDDDHMLSQVRAACMLGGRLLSAMAEIIPSKKVLPFIMPHITAIASDPLGADPLRKKGVIIALAAVSEGCAARVRRQVPSVLLLVKQLMADPLAYVREAAAYSLAYFCEHLQPEILSHHQELMPLLLAQLEDPEDRVRARVTRVLDSLCEHVGDDLEAYIPELIAKLTATLPASSPATQRHVCGALASIAQTQCPAVTEHAPQLMELLRGAVAAPSPVLLRAQAMETVGVLALAVGAAGFEPFYAYFLQQAMAGFGTAYAELKENCFGFCANMAELHGGAFLPHVSAVLDCIKKTIEEDNAKVTSDDPMAKVAGGFHLGDNDVDEEDDDDEGAFQRFTVRTADVEEKSAAVYCLGVFAEKLGPHFGPYVAASVDLVQDHVSHFHEAIRENAVGTLMSLLVCFNSCHPYARAIGLPTEESMHADVRTALDTLMRGTIIPLIKEEDNKKIVAAACDAVVELMNHTGAVGIHPYITEVFEGVQLLLRNEAPCQFDEDDAEDGEEGLGDDDDHDGVMIDSCSEIIDTAAAAYGPAFAPFFTELAPDLLAYCAAGRPGEDHVMAMGVVATALMALKEAAAPFFDTGLELALRMMAESEEPAARSNACFAIRALTENVGERMTPDVVNALLTALVGVATGGNEYPNAIDNAISATCTLVQRCAAAMPLPQVLPVLLQNLPMKADKDENENGINCLAYLATHHGAAVAADAALLNAFVACLGRTLASTTVTPALKQALVGGVHATFVVPNHAAVAAAAGALQKRQKDAVQKHLFAQ
jgi:hypothetical protein